MQRRGRKILRALLIFPRTIRGWIWHLATSNASEAGCRGVTGPVPQPLNMRFVISTNADRLIFKVNPVNRFLGFSYRYRSRSDYSPIHEIPQNFTLFCARIALRFLHFRFVGAGSESARKLTPLTMEDPGETGDGISPRLGSRLAGQ